MNTRPVLPLVVLALLAVLPLPSMSQSCQARSAATVPVLVELYTSEGCDSCPPADKWLSALNARSDVVAAAFHVDYWDHLGWKDRFGSAQYTARQAAQTQRSGARFSYTPQVLANGQDWKRWPALPAANTASLVAVTLQREADARVTVNVTPLAGAPQKLALWWALLEDGHTSDVKAGENRGATLRHDHVVRAYGEQPAWTAAARTLTLSAPARGEGGRSAQLLVVVTDGSSGAPLQVLKLAC